MKDMLRRGDILRFAVMVVMLFSSYFRSREEEGRTWRCPWVAKRASPQRVNKSVQRERGNNNTRPVLSKVWKMQRRHLIVGRVKVWKQWSVYVCVWCALKEEKERKRVENKN